MIAPKTTERERELIPAETHLVKCISVIDTGTEEGTFYNKQTWKDETVKQRKIWITFEFPEIEKENDWVMKPVVKWASYTLSFSENANLYKLVKNRGFDVNVAEWFDMNLLLGKAWLWAVTHTTAKNGKVYDNLTSVSPLMKSMIVTEGTFHPIVMFDMDSWEWMENLQNKINAMPKFLQEKIKVSPEWNKLSDEYMQNMEKFVGKEDGDLPF